MGGGPRGEDSAAPEEDEPEVRGWVPPEERPWRHPSEVPWASPPGAAPPRPGPRSREAWVSALVGAGAAAIVVVAGLFIASPRPTGTNTGAPNGVTEPRPVGHGLVALLTTGAGATTLDCAVAIGAGGLVATTADALAGATSVEAWRNGHWVSASIVGADATSDIGLVRVPFDVPAARFTDEDAVAPGTRVWTMGVTSVPFGSTQGGAAWSAWAGTVSAAGTAVNGTRGEGMPSIVVAPLVTTAPTGGVLVAADGAVLGIEDTSVVPGATGEVFLPADLVVGVSLDLAAGGPVSHGWLGINGGPARAAGGAVVEAVDPSGPAVGVLEQGDVIVAIDSTPVHTMADLRSRLYMLPVGSPVWLRIDRLGALTTVELGLGSSP